MSEVSPEQNVFGSTMLAVRVSVTRPLPASDARELLGKTDWRRVFFESITDMMYVEAVVCVCVTEERLSWLDEWVCGT